MVSEKELLTIEEVSEMFGYAVGSIKNQFKRTAAAINKKFGVNILRVKKSDGKTYYALEKIDERALTIFDENKDLYVPLESLQLQTYEFYILLVVVVSEYGTYRGTYDHLLKYIGMSITKKNVTLSAVRDKYAKETTDALPENRPEHNIILYQCLPKGRKLDEIVKRATEIGVTAIIPVKSRNCVVNVEERREENRLDRYNSLIKEALEQ